jgi:hypothetical protein
MSDLVRRIFRRDPETRSGTAAGRQPGGAPRSPDDVATALIAGAIAGIGDRYLRDADFRTQPDVKALIEADEDVRRAALLALVEARLSAKPAHATWSLLNAMTRRRLVLSADQLSSLLGMLEPRFEQGDSWKVTYVIERIAQVIERSFAELDGPRRAPLSERVAKIVAVIDADNKLRVEPAAIKRLRNVLPVTDGVALDGITNDDAVGPAFRAVFEQTGERVAALAPFAAHLIAGLRGGRPSAAWFTKSAELGAKLSDAPALVRALLQAALDAGDQPVRYDYGMTLGRDEPYVYETIRYVSPGNEAILRNVVWTAAAIKDARAIPQLRALADKTIGVIGGQFGQPRSLKVALACPAAIAEIGAPGSLTALQGLQRSVRHGSLLREVGKAIDALASAQHVSRSELLETAIERHDLDEHGRRQIPVGDWTAAIEVAGSGDVETTWLDPQGKARPSLPKSVKDAESAAAKEVSTAGKAIRDTIAAERVRLDRLFTENRRWPLAEWRERYLEHPITGTLARSLIWRFGTVVGMPSVDGSTATDASGMSRPIPDDADVALWHPIEATDEEIRAWRERLMTERLRQPLKQAFRELYVVTPAELETQTYSNRFAGHVIRQVQARALMKGRGWAPVAVAWWDDGIDVGVARRTLDAHGLRVEFFYDPITDIQPTTSDLYPYCTTDQVRFFRAGTDDAMAVADVSQVAFTEVMRDVDLFVGVTTIGADAQWLDRGERRFDEYWRTWGFGELGQPAKVRRDVIAKLLPALKIADRSTLGDRYLEVRGSLRTYKIHLGSGNIMMSPSDRYLCIVAARHPSDNRLFLPFADDPMLSLILSKAFLLADDGSIKDESILRQIKNG